MRRDESSEASDPNEETADSFELRARKLADLSNIVGASSPSCAAKGKDATTSSDPLQPSFDAHVSLISFLLLYPISSSPRAFG